MYLTVLLAPPVAAKEVKLPHGQATANTGASPCLVTRRRAHHLVHALFEVDERRGHSFNPWSSRKVCGGNNSPRQGPLERDSGALT